MSLYQDAVRERERLLNSLQRIRRRIAALPEGDFTCRANGSHFKWFRVTDPANAAEPAAASNMSRSTSSHRKHEFEYIPRSQAELAGQLAIKKYYRCQEEDVLTQIKGIERFLHCVDCECRHTEKLLANKGMAELVLPQLAGERQEFRQWMHEDYPRNPNRPESLRIPTIGGFNVRSKSEALIANLLIERELPFRYECQLQLGMYNYYPDFTILHPQTRAIVIWEHFGMMSSQAYQTECANKICNYIMNGYRPYQNLITTFESEDEPFDVAAAERNLRILFGME